MVEVTHFYGNVWPALGRYMSSGDVAGEQIHGDHDQLACPLDNVHVHLCPRLGGGMWLSLPLLRFLEFFERCA